MDLVDRQGPPATGESAPENVLTVYCDDRTASLQSDETEASARAALQP